MNYVYVLDKEGRPLMPTARFGKVRRMLKEGKAVPVNTKPFTIRLTYEPETHIVQNICVGIDAGRTNIGMAAVRGNGQCLYRSHITTKNKSVPLHMKKRAEHRHDSRKGERSRRQRRAREYSTEFLDFEHDDNGYEIPVGKMKKAILYRQEKGICPDTEKTAISR